MERRSVDSNPLLETRSNSDNNNNNNSMRRMAALQGAARFIRRQSSRRIMREPSIMVRETAAQQLEERQADWAHSKPVVILDLLWNLAFVAVSVVVLACSVHESPSLPLRVWIGGYILQCCLHMIYVLYEFRRRRRNRQRIDSEDEQPTEETSSVIKRLETVNTMFSFFWWIVGFYWIIAGGKSLSEEAPRLYWLCVAFLAFDVFFVVFCIALACVIGIAVCCCLPCIIAILYAVADQNGASEADLSLLPKYRFCRAGPSEKIGGEKARTYGGIMSLTSGEATSEKPLEPEDAECCICLSAYEDGAELHELPCSHHFHCACIQKWLRMNATCPLCKYDIVKNREECNV